MKAVIKRASASLRKNKPLWSVTAQITEGEFEGKEITVFHNPRTETANQKTATRIFIEASGLEKSDFGRCDLHKECEVIRRVNQDGDSVVVDWEFIAAPQADEAALAAFDA